MKHITQKLLENGQPKNPPNKIVLNDNYVVYGNSFTSDSYIIDVTKNAHMTVETGWIGDGITFRNTTKD